jgi:putative transcriptional regulator
MMEEQLFRELVASIKEAGTIKRGKKGPACREVFQDPDPRQIRERLNLSRGDFAAVSGVSLRTLEGLEQGRRRPTDSARRLLQVASRHLESLLDSPR